jgi:hypothetical protein
VRRSEVLSANNLGQLGNSERIPGHADMAALVEGLERLGASEEAYGRYERLGDYRAMLATAAALAREGHPRAARLAERAAKVALGQEDNDFAWKALLYGQTLG